MLDSNGLNHKVPKYMWDDPHYFLLMVLGYITLHAIILFSDQKSRITGEYGGVIPEKCGEDKGVIPDI